MPNAIVVHTDGACKGNPGPGGWAAHIRYQDDKVKELGGFAPRTTNNRMELTAAVMALKELEDETAPIRVISDSEYLIHGITSWILLWKKRGWKTTSKKPVLNCDLWQELDGLCRDNVSWEYTKGHAGNPDNERCDRIAGDFARRRSVELRWDY